MGWMWVGVFLLIPKEMNASERRKAFIDKFWETLFWRRGGCELNSGFLFAQPIVCLSPNRSWISLWIFGISLKKFLDFLVTLLSRRRCELNSRFLFAQPIVCLSPNIQTIGGGIIISLFSFQPPFLPSELPYWLFSISTISDLISFLQRNTKMKKRKTRLFCHSYCSWWRMWSW